ncbi:hypothetical protein EBR21_06465, partial [bacterium]|nr:hypothetical protein [bacterium]
MDASSLNEKMKKNNDLKFQKNRRKRISKMNRKILTIPSLPLLMTIFAFSTFSAHSALASETSTRADEPIATRLKKLKTDIDGLKSETDVALKEIAENQEKNGCLSIVHTGIAALTDTLNALGEQGTIPTLGSRVTGLVKQHTEFFDELTSFAENTLELSKQPQGNLADDSKELNDILDKTTKMIHSLRERYDNQAAD